MDKNGPVMGVNMVGCTKEYPVTNHYDTTYVKDTSLINIKVYPDGHLIIATIVVSGEYKRDSIIATKNLVWYLN